MTIFHKSLENVLLVPVIVYAFLASRALQGVKSKTKKWIKAQGSEQKQKNLYF